jgi:ribosome biogenesis GTPase
VKGLVVRLEANRPTVRLDDGREWLCHLAGRLRRDIGRIRVGDRVTVESTTVDEGVVTVVEPRSFTLQRPPVANVSGLVVVFTLVYPASSLDLLDRRLVLAELYGLDLLVLAHKADLVDAERRRDLAPWARLYPIVWTSTRTGEGLPGVPELIGPGIHVMTGESGVGKSSLLELLTQNQAIATGTLSRWQRGRQTTRTVSLHRLGDGYLSDTPGFSRFRLPPMTAEELKWAFPEFRDLTCRFHDCLHRDEPGCAVPEAREAGSISGVRYRHYLEFLGEVMR